MMMSADSIDLLLLSRERERDGRLLLSLIREGSESGGTMMAMTFSRFNDIAKTTSVLMVKSDGMNVCVCVCFYHGHVRSCIVLHTHMYKYG